MSKFERLKKKLDNAEVNLKIYKQKIKDNNITIKKECEEIGLKFDKLKDISKTIKQKKNKLENQKDKLEEKINNVLEEIESESF